MDPFSTLFSIQLIFFALAIFALTFIIRTILEYFISKLKTSNEWNNLILPLIPLVLGALGGLSKTYPNPLGTSLFARETFGLVAGLVSGLGYQIVKGYITTYLANKAATLTQAGVNVTPSSVAPAITQEPIGMSSDIHPQ